MRLLRPAHVQRGGHAGHIHATATTTAAKVASCSSGGQLRIRRVEGVWPPRVRRIGTAAAEELLLVLMLLLRVHHSEPAVAASAGRESAASVA